MKKANTWRLNSLLPNNQEVTEEVKKESLKIPRNTWQWKHNNPKALATLKAGLREDFIAVQANVKKWEKHQINSLALHLEQLEKDQQQINPNISRKKEIIKIRAETKWKRNEESKSKDQ